jgi:hypothetical protein
MCERPNANSRSTPAEVFGWRPALGGWTEYEQQTWTLAVARSVGVGGRVIDKGEGVYEVRYIVLVASEFDIAIELDGIRVGSAPSRLASLATRTAASESTIWGIGVTHGQVEAGQSDAVYFRPADRFGNERM